MLVTLISKILTALNSNVKKEQIAAGMSCGVLLALVPAGNLLWILLFTLTFFFKIHYGMQMLVLAVLKLALPLFAPLLDALGWAILNMDALAAFLGALYNAPLAPFTRFYNSLVMGGLVAGLVLWLPLFLAFGALIAWYRAKMAPRVTQSRAYRAFMKIPLINSIAGACSSLSKLRGALQ